jgi:hypothetical protein
MSFGGCIYSRSVTRDGFTEAYEGDLLGLVGTPRVVVLGLNPGGYSPRFQARDGIFANELREAHTNRPARSYGAIRWVKLTSQ